MPGLTIARISSRTCRTMCPARRILSISAGDLQTIAILKHFQRLSGDGFHISLTVNHMQTAHRPVILGQGLRQLLIFLQALSDDALTVVLARDQLCAVHVAYCISSGWLKVDVVDPTAGRTRTSSGEPLE